VLQHVALEVSPDVVPRCLEFWSVLGFEPVDPPASLTHRVAWVQRGPTQIHLLYAEDPVAPPEGHAAVVVDAYEATLTALRGLGLEPEPRREHWGAPRAFVRDPAGHRVELMAAPPGGSSPLPPAGRRYGGGSGPDSSAP
jgi:catechol 2,3-dioxygenase-like lactoylglutathione lyase family enzyme